MDIADIRKKAQGKRKSQEREKDAQTPDTPVTENRDSSAQQTQNVPPSVSLEKRLVQEETIIPESKKLPQESLAPTEEFYKRQLADKETEDDQLQFLSFKVYNEEYALSLSDIKEVIKMREITEVPYAPPFITGIVSLRGEIIPTMNLQKRLGLKDESMMCVDQDTRIVIASHTNTKLGFIVDKILGVVRINPKDIESTSPIQQGVGVEFLKGVIHHKGRFIIVLNLPMLFKIEEAAP